EARWYRVLMERTNEGHPIQRFVPLSPEDLKSSIDPIPYVSVKMGQGPVAYYSLDQLSDRRSYLLRMGSLAQDKHALFVKAAGIARALINAMDGFLLIEEAENGLHYSIQPDVWRLIFRVASRMNVQVLATTHSWDCIEAFQTAASEAGPEVGMLIRLRQKGGKI